AIDNDLSLPAVECWLRIPKGLDKFLFRTALQPVERMSGQPLAAADFAKFYPNATPPTTALIELEVKSPGISIKWQTDIGTYGEGVVLRSEGGKPSALEPLKNVDDWSKFKDYATSLPSHHFIFRGQENNVWRLRTAFRRTHRASLKRF